MGVYKPKRRDPKTGEKKETPYWHYDFTIEGDRFYGSTGQKTKRAAEQYEERKRKEVADGTIDKVEAAADPADMTFNEAAGVYWEDIGQSKRACDEIERDLETLVELIGADKRIGDIRTPTVRMLMKDRREGKGARVKPNPSPATMNRLLECLRATLNHIAEEHEAALPRISWKRLMQKEAPPPERTFSPEELQRWGEQLNDIERFFLMVAYTYGPRMGELFMPPASVDTSNSARPVMQLGRYFGRKERDVRKDGTLYEVALLPEDALALQWLADGAAESGLKHIWWCYDAKGRRKPLNYYGMRRRLLSAAERAKVAPGRLIHSLRHHAASAIVADSGDIMLARRALGHSSVTTTQRYAHARDDKLLASLARVSVNRPELPIALLGKAAQNQQVRMVPPPGLEPGTIEGERMEKPQQKQRTAPAAEGETDA